MHILVFQKKKKKKISKYLSVLILCVVLNIAFLKETKICMENPVIFGCFCFFNFPCFKQTKLQNTTTSITMPHFKDKSY